MINFIKYIAAIGLIVLISSPPVEGIKNDICPAGEPCSCEDGKCAAYCQNGTCPPYTSCTSCPSKVVTFVGEPGTIYSLPENTFFICGPEKNSPQNMTTPAKGIGISSSGYQICPSAILQAPSVAPSKMSAFELQSGVIYSFSQGIAFVCTSSNEPPQKISAPNPVGGLPSEYWTCPPTLTSSPVKKP